MRIAISLLLAAGCATNPTVDEPVLGTPENPLPSEAGPYAVRTTVDVTVEAVLPPQIALVVETLRLFETNPAGALISIADQAGVPAVGALDSLPSVIKSRLESFLNDEINKLNVNGKPITEYAGDIAGYAELALTQFALDSELDMMGDRAKHRLTALDLEPAGLDVRVQFGGHAGDVLTQEPTTIVTAGGRVAFGDQRFGLDYGEYAWQGIEGASMQQFGGTVRDTLGNAVNCPALAAKVASKCVLGVCVGHEPELREVCEGGLDALVNKVHERISAMRLEALHFASGDAHLVDADSDGVADTITDGTWTAELDVGFGLRHAPATFEGTR